MLSTARRQTAVTASRRSGSEEKHDGGRKQGEARELAHQVRAFFSTLPSGLRLAIHLAILLASPESLFPGRTPCLGGPCSSRSAGALFEETEIFTRKYLI